MKKNLIKAMLLIILLVLAVVLGVIIANVCKGSPALSWLATSASFGIQPTMLNLSVIQLTFGLNININVAQALLLLIAIIVYSNIKIRN